MPSHSKDQHLDQGIWKELSSLFFPIIIGLLAGSVVGLFERIWLAQHSIDSWKGGMQAVCALQFFQMSCVVFANMTQIFVGQHLGLNEPEKVGNRVWQMIWVSLLLMLLIFPLSLMIDPLMFKGTEQREIANGYFKILISGNILFPLGAVLSSFFLAQDKRWIIVWSVLGASGINILLNSILISGFPPICPPLGAIGAAWSSLVSKFVFCLILFSGFLSRLNQAQYHTWKWQVTLSSLWECFRICTPRATGRAFNLLVWTAITSVMTTKGGHYLSVFSIGATLALFSTFLSESLIQSLSIVISRYLASKEYSKLWKRWRLGVFFALFVAAVLAIPFLVFPKATLSLFFSEIPPHIESLLQLTLCWIWCWVLLNGLNAPFFALLLAVKDTFYYMVLMSLTWVTSFLPIYYGFHHLQWEPHAFWLVLVIDHAIILSLNTWRVYSLRNTFLGVTNPNSARNVR